MAETKRYKLNLKNVIRHGEIGNRGPDPTLALGYNETDKDIFGEIHQKRLDNEGGGSVSDSDISLDELRHYMTQWIQDSDKHSRANSISTSDFFPVSARCCNGEDDDDTYCKYFGMNPISGYCKKYKEVILATFNKDETKSVIHNCCTQNKDTTDLTCKQFGIISDGQVCKDEYMSKVCIDMGGKNILEKECKEMANKGEYIKKIYNEKMRKVCLDKDDNKEYNADEETFDRHKILKKLDNNSCMNWCKENPFYCNTTDLKELCKADFHNGEFKYNNICGCHYPEEYYDKIKKIFSKQYHIDESLIDTVKKCLSPLCQSATIQEESEKDISCPSTSLVNCVQDINVNAKNSTIDKLTINQDAHCRANINIKKKETDKMNLQSKNEPKTTIEEFENGLGLRDSSINLIKDLPGVENLVGLGKKNDEIKKKRTIELGGMDPAIECCSELNALMRAKIDCPPKYHPNGEACKALYVEDCFTGLVNDTGHLIKENLTSILDPSCGSEAGPFLKKQFNNAMAEYCLGRDDIDPKEKLVRLSNPACYRWCNENSYFCPTEDIKNICSYDYNNRLFEHTDLCGCHYPDNYYSTIRDKISETYSIDKKLVDSMNKCISPFCKDSPLKRNDEKDKPCPEHSLVNCIQNVNLNVPGSQLNSVEINQKGNCKSIVSDLQKGKKTVMESYHDGEKNNNFFTIMLGVIIILIFFLIVYKLFLKKK